MPAYCEVALPVPIERAFTYAIRQGQVPLRVARVIVPFRNEKLIGVVTSLQSTAPPDFEVRYIETVLDEEPLLRGLGPEPLGNEFDAAMLARACAGKKTSLKAALLDQRVVAGLGNIYVCEALYRAHLSPRRLAATLATKKGETTDHAQRLVGAIHAVLNQAIKAGGSSLRDHRQTSGELGYFQHSFQVYDREGEKCQTAGCTGVVKRFTQNGRSTFWCPKCQK